MNLFLDIFHFYNINFNHNTNDQININFAIDYILPIIVNARDFPDPNKLITFVNKDHLITSCYLLNKIKEGFVFIHELQSPCYFKIGFYKSACCYRKSSDHIFFWNCGSDKKT